MGIARALGPYLLFASAALAPPLLFGAVAVRAVRSEEDATTREEQRALADTATRNLHAIESALRTSLEAAAATEPMTAARRVLQSSAPAFADPLVLSSEGF